MCKAKWSKDFLISMSQTEREMQTTALWGNVTGMVQEMSPFLE